MKIQHAICGLILTGIIGVTSGFASEPANGLAAKVIEKLTLRAALLDHPEPGSGFDAWVDRLATTKTQPLWVGLSNDKLRELAEALLQPSADANQNAMAIFERQMTESSNQTSSTNARAQFRLRPQDATRIQQELSHFRLLSSEVRAMRLELEARAARR